MNVHARFCGEEMSEEHLNRKLFVGEYVDKDHKIDGGVRERTEKVR